MRVRGLCCLRLSLLGFAVLLAGCDRTGGRDSTVGGSSTSNSTAPSPTVTGSAKSQAGKEPDATNPGSKGAESRASADPGKITIVSSLPRTGNARQQTDTIV